jgi:glycosyltransferase involved in cell wall biosynthesis
MLFDIAFKPAQILTWTDFRRMHRLSPRMSFVLQDIIAARSDYLAYPILKTIFAKSAELADQVYTISEFSHQDFEAYFGISLSSRTIHHGTNAGMDPFEWMKGEYVLLVGNNFAHKGVKESVGYLTEVGPVRVLGGDKPDEELPVHVKWFVSGKLTRGHVRELYAKASVVVFPSHYEGYGLPIIEGLALGKPVVALDNQLNRELNASLKDDNLTLIKSVRHLRTAVIASLQKSSVSPVFRTTKVRRWSDVAKDYVAGLSELLAHPQNREKMRARSNTLRLLDSSNHP